MEMSGVNIDVKELRNFLDNAPRRRYEPIFGIRISHDHGNKWRLVAICKTCFNDLEPPIRAINEGTAGVGKCDWCGVHNILNLSEPERTAYIDSQMKPIFTADLNNPQQMQELKSVVGKDAIDAAFNNAKSYNEAMNTVRDNCEKIMSDRENNSL